MPDEPTTEYRREMLAAQREIVNNVVRQSTLLEGLCKASETHSEAVSAMAAAITANGEKKITLPSALVKTVVILILAGLFALAGVQGAKEIWSKTIPVPAMGATTTEAPHGP